MSFKRLHLTHRASSAPWKHALSHTHSHICLTCISLGRVLNWYFIVELNSLEWSVVYYAVTHTTTKSKTWFQFWSCFCLHFFRSLRFASRAMPQTQRCCCQWPDCVLFATAAAHLYSHSVDGWHRSWTLWLFILENYYGAFHSVCLSFFPVRFILVCLRSIVRARVPHF